MAYALHHGHGISHSLRVLADAHKLTKHLLYVGHVEVSSNN